MSILILVWFLGVHCMTVFLAMEKPTGTVRHIGQLDDVMKRNFERLRQYANAEIAKCEEAIKIQKDHIEQLNTDIRRIRSFPHQLRHDDWLPVSDYAFVRGTFDNTNKFYTMLGSEYFAERSATETIAYLERKITATKDTIKTLEKQRDGAASRVTFSEMFQDTEDMVEIQEPFCPEALKPGTMDAKEVSQEDFDDVMKRLDELEKQEDDNGELVEGSVEKDGGEKAEKVKPDPVVEPKPVKLIAPKGVSQEDFEALIKKVDEMVATSDSESDYEDEGEDDDDEEALDSDDSLPADAKQVPITEPKPSNPAPPNGPDAPLNPERRRSVAFAPTLERGPSPVSTAEAETLSVPTKSILRNKDVKTPVDEAAVRAMDESDVKPKKILPATDAFRGTFIEHEHVFLPSTSTAGMKIAPAANKHVSRFKQQRRGFN